MCPAARGDAASQAKPLPVSVLVAQPAEPTQVTANACSPNSPHVRWGAVNYLQEDPTVTVVEPMDEMAHLKHPRDVSDDERGANNAMPKENGRAVAIGHLV